MSHPNGWLIIFAEYGGKALPHNKLVAPVPTKQTAGNKNTHANKNWACVFYVQNSNTFLTLAHFLIKFDKYKSIAIIYLYWLILP